MDIPCWQDRMKDVVAGNIFKNIILSDEGYSYYSERIFKKTHRSALQIDHQD